MIALTVAGCTLQPAYRLPQVETADAWEAETPHGGRTEELVDWWARFDDPVVAELIRIAEAGSPTLAKASAKIDNARATLASSSASAWPSITGSGSLIRADQQRLNIPGVPTTSVGVTDTHSGEFDATWEVDLFGKLRSSRDAAQALLQARVDDWHDARVSLAAEVADNYVRYRACRQLAKAYEDHAASQAQTARSTRVAVEAGFTAPADGYLAEASAASTAAAAVAQDTECEGLVKSLVELTGAEEGVLRAMIDKGSPALPEPSIFSVDNVPADLLRRRPDLASAERALAASYAEIGVARAGRFPSLSLGGLISISASNLAPSATSWSFGPSLALPIFDGGNKKAAVASAQAGYDEARADYISSVRTAVKEVEQALVNLQGAARRSEDSRKAAEEYRRYFLAIEANWRAGNDSLLTLEEARRSAITAQTTLIGLQRDRVRYWIALYKVLGGGWDANSARIVPVARAAPSSEEAAP